MNLLTQYASYNVKWNENESGQVVLTCPRLIHPVIKKLLKPFIKKHYYHITLDEFGSFVWLNIRNDRTIGHIGQLLQKQFGESIEPVYERLGVFINTLAANKFIVLIADK